MIQYWWIPLLIGYYAAYAWATTKASDSWWWVLAIAGIAFLGPWAVVGRYSKNLAADGLLYDVITLFAFYGALMIMGTTQKWSSLQYAGAGLVVLGMILLKWPTSQN